MEESHNRYSLGQKIPENLDNFVEKVLQEPTQKDAFLDLLLVNRENLMSKVETEAILATAITKPLSLKSVTVGKCQQNFNPGHEESRLQATQGTGK